MQGTIDHLRKIADTYSGKLGLLSEEVFSEKANPDKWSKKEILGHLVDSAQNNVRRFVVAQYETIPSIRYDQEQWVKLAGYQQHPTMDLIFLWTLFNRHICQVLMATSPAGALRKCDTGAPEAHTIEWLAADYIRHLLHHLHQIVDLEPIAYP
jgi:hypothetical protein